MTQTGDPVFELHSLVVSGAGTEGRRQGETRPSAESGCPQPANGLKATAQIILRKRSEHVGWRVLPRWPLACVPTERPGKGGSLQKDAESEDRRGFLGLRTVRLVAGY